MRKRFLFIFLIITILAFFTFGKSIWQPMVSNIRGKETAASINEKYATSALERLQPYLQKKGFDQLPDQIMFIALKEERILELWGMHHEKWEKIKEYPFTAFSGVLGPKRKEGDRQIPEGIYTIEFLNPNSAYHLSLKVNYPNAFDKAKAAIENRTDLGTNIFIHGKSSTIGCIPIGDQGIEEVFVLSSIAIDKGIKVIISPRDFRIHSEIPSIENITWEKELYDILKEELLKYTS